MREKYCWLADDWKLVLERCERKILLGWRLLELRNRVIGICCDAVEPNGLGYHYQPTITRLALKSIIRISKIGNVVLELLLLGQVGP